MTKALTCAAAALLLLCAACKKKEEPQKAAPDLPMPASEPVKPFPQTPPSGATPPTAGGAAGGGAASSGGDAAVEQSFDAALKNAKGVIGKAQAATKGSGAAPDFTAIHKLIGKNQAAQAAALLERRIAVDPKDREAWRELGLLNKRLGKDPNVALKDLTQALDLDPGHGHLVAELTDLYRKLGKREDGLTALKAAADRHPGSEDILMAEGDLYREVGKPAESLAAYKQAAAVPDASLETKKGLARALSGAKQPGEAAGVWKEVLQFHEQALQEVRARGDKTDGIEADIANTRLELARALLAGGDKGGAQDALDGIKKGAVPDKDVAELRAKLQAQ